MTRLSDAEIAAWMHDAQEHGLPAAPINVIGRWSDGSETPIECGYSHFDAEHGVHAWLPIVPDRGEVTLVGFTIDLLPPMTGLLAPPGYDGNFRLIEDDQPDDS